jgi:glyoxylase-like metal-dependent hydrolase (beta-lactamase superfamily II)
VAGCRRADHQRGRGADRRHLAGDDSVDGRNISADAVEPILDAGLADVVEPDADLGDGLRLAPTPGHTPGQVALWLDCGDRPVVLAGDVLHHPLQCVEPDIGFVVDAEGRGRAAGR